MAILRHFCCCFHVRNGSIFCGVYSLISCAIFIGLLVVRYVGYEIVDSSPAYSVAVFSTVAIFVVDLLLAIFLIIGVYRDIKALIFPWIVFTVTCIFEGSGVLCWLLVTRMRIEGSIPSWEAGITAFHLCNSILLIYCLLCVISQLQDLIAGKGTARDYRRRRQRRRLRQMGLANEFYIPDLEAHNGLPPPGPGGPGPVIEAPPYADKPPPYERADSQVYLIEDDNAEHIDHSAPCPNNININVIDGELYEAGTSNGHVGNSRNSYGNVIDQQIYEAGTNNDNAAGSRNSNLILTEHQSNERSTSNGNFATSRYSNINLTSHQNHESSASIGNAATFRNDNTSLTDQQMYETNISNIGAQSTSYSNHPAEHAQQHYYDNQRQNHHHDIYHDDAYDRNDEFTARLDFSSDMNSFEHSEGEEYQGASTIGGNITINAGNQRHLGDNNLTHVFVPYPVLVLPQDVPTDLLTPEVLPTASNYIHPYEQPAPTSRHHRSAENNERSEQRRRTRSQRNKPRTRRNSEQSRRRRTPSLHADYIRSTVHSLDQHGRITNLSQDMFSENLHSPHFQRDNPVLLNPNSVVSRSRFEQNNSIVQRPSVHPVCHNDLELYPRMQTVPAMHSSA